MVRFEPHCHLIGSLTPADVVAIAERYPPDASLAVVGDGASLLSLAREGAAAVAARWSMRLARRRHCFGAERLATFSGPCGGCSAGFGARAASPNSASIIPIARRRAWQQLRDVSELVVHRQASRWQQQQVSRVDLRARTPRRRAHWLPNMSDIC